MSELPSSSISFATRSHPRVAAGAQARGRPAVGVGWLDDSGTRSCRPPWWPPCSAPSWAGGGDLGPDPVDAQQAARLDPGPACTGSRPGPEVVPDRPRCTRSPGRRRRLAHLDAGRPWAAPRSARRRRRASAWWTPGPARRRRGAPTLAGRPVGHLGLARTTCAGPRRHPESTRSTPRTSGTTPATVRSAGDVGHAPSAPATWIDRRARHRHRPRPPRSRRRQAACRGGTPCTATGARRRQRPRHLRRRRRRCGHDQQRQGHRRGLLAVAHPPGEGPRRERDAAPTATSSRASAGPSPTAPT